MSEANRIASAKAMEFQEDFRARKRELAELSYLHLPDFYMQKHQGWQELVAIDFLMEKADGYRFLNTNFGVELSNAASSPRNTRPL
ncbi:hypothetical protein J7I84_01940 [Arthrobacter sp. ISL-85]|uniref:hypothetical protein n=1 Tax=Arthrobacter sp. ISL-85 TaxID=2819115 RepID=UPI001BEC368C|nr:hypothetical protein [Arthrobacter sp. ISL-85]MBT2565268.1 hypothetical protein [Arthrobacter sp. ISL-85]